MTSVNLNDLSLLMTSFNLNDIKFEEHILI